LMGESQFSSDLRRRFFTFIVLTRHNGVTHR
jgi:hypothetical protein